MSILGIEREPVVVAQAGGGLGGAQGLMAGLSVRAGS